MNVAMELAMTQFFIRPLITSDIGWVDKRLAERWGSSLIVTRGRIHQAAELPGFAAMQRDTQPEEPIGLVTYHVESEHCEIVSLDSFLPGLEIGSALLDATVQAGFAAGCRRIWLITTNYNMAALRFYQRRGFRLSALYPGAIAVSRKLKPQISLIGMDGIPIRDEIELEKTVGDE